MIIGIIHVLHCPFLILLPFFVNNHIFNILYIEYFFIIMFLYTFINGECPISYFYKKQKDAKYIAGSRITDYSEISDLFFYPRETKTEKLISIYFGTNTCMYLASFMYVIYRDNIPFSLFIIPMNYILFYFSFIYMFQNHTLFYVIQNVNKTILFLFILCLIGREINI